MKILIALIAVPLFLLACQKEGTNACTAENPFDAPWLKSIQDSLQNCYCVMSIVQGTYDGQTVFYVAMTDPLCDGIMIPVLLDCEGEVVKQYTYDNYHDFYDEVAPNAVLYRCHYSR